jgi:hypothetical protein
VGGLGAHEDVEPPRGLPGGHRRHPLHRSCDPAPATALVEVLSWCGCFILGLNLSGHGLRDLRDPKMQSVRSAAQE